MQPQDQPKLTQALSQLFQHPAFRFLMLGAVSFTLSLSLSALFTDGLRIPEEISVAMTLVLVFFFNFWILRWLVFKSDGGILQQLGKFAAASLGFRGAEYLLFLALLHVAGLYYLLALGVALCLSLIGKYLFHKHVTFRS